MNLILLFYRKLNCGYILYRTTYILEYAWVCTHVYMHALDIYMYTYTYTHTCELFQKDRLTNYFYLVEIDSKPKLQKYSKEDKEL